MSTSKVQLPSLIPARLLSSYKNQYVGNYPKGRYQSAAFAPGGMSLQAGTDIELKRALWMVADFSNQDTLAPYATADMTLNLLDGSTLLGISVFGIQTTTDESPNDPNTFAVQIYDANRGFPLQTIPMQGNAVFGKGDSTAFLNTPYDFVPERAQALIRVINQTANPHQIQVVLLCCNDGAD